MPGESLIGNLAVLLTMETAAFEKGTSHATKLLRKTQRDFESMATKVAGIGSKMSLAITAPLVGFGAVALKEANEANQAMAQVNAALASMGPVAGKTADQLKKASDALELSSLFEGDEILKKVTANLLTFGNISGQAFDRAQQAAVNLSARLGQDLQSSAIQVGKALNDPVKGINALARVGVQFSASQKEMIKTLVETGHTAQAQSIILGELERQFGGAALAAQNADPYNKATDAFKQMAETVGNALLPLIPPLTNAIVSIANAFSSLSPATQKWLIIAGGVAAVLGPIAVAFGAIISVTGSLLPLLIKLGPAWTALSTALAAARVAAIASLPALVPLLVPLAAITVAVAAGYLAWKNWSKIAPIVQNMAAGVTAAINRLAAPFKWVAEKAKQVGDAFRTLYDRVVGHSYIPDMVDEIGQHMARLETTLVQPVTNATGKAGEAFRALQERVSSLLDRLFPEQAAQNQFNKDLQDLEQYANASKMSVDELAEAVGRLREQYTGLSRTPPPSDAITGDIAPLAPDHVDIDFEGLGKLIDGTSKVADNTQRWRDTLSEIGQALFQRIGDDLSRIVEGSMKLKDLWKDLVAFGLQVLSSPNGPLGNIFGGARAMGGPVVSGKAYLVGERGPEIFAPGKSGQIVPNHMLSSGRGDTVMNIYTPNADSFRRSEGQITRQWKRRMATN